MEQKIFKVCLLGDTNVGKTSILERYVFNTFNPHTDTTIGAQFLSKMIEYNNTIVKLQLWDTAGQERYRALVSMYYRNCDAIVLVVDITNTKSIENIVFWMNELNYNTENTPVFLVMNKIDLLHSNEYQVESCIERFKNYTIIKVSAKQNVNIEELFNMVIKKIMNDSQFEPNNTIQVNQKTSLSSWYC